MAVLTISNSSMWSKNSVFALINVSAPKKKERKWTTGILHLLLLFLFH